MSAESNNDDVVTELAFDVSKPSEAIEFLGFVADPRQPRKELTGLFDWTCRGCTFHNRSSTTIEPMQVFLTKWVCSSCGKVTLVRFRSRANAEWVAQHTVAITGATLGRTTEPAPLGTDSTGRPSLLRQGGQKIFALVAIPALVLIILLALNDPKPISSDSRSVSRGRRPQSRSTPSSRLPGYWANEAGDQVLYFGPIDSASKTGTYVLNPEGRTASTWVRFAVVREARDGMEMVIRELDENGEARTSSETTLCLPQEGGEMIRAGIAQERPVVAVYHRIDRQQVHAATDP